MTHPLAFAESPPEQVNLASFLVGGRIESTSSQGAIYPVYHLLDGKTDTFWETEYKDATREVVISFFDRKEAALKEVAVNLGENPSGMAVKELEVFLSSEAEGNNFQSAGVFTCAQESADQTFPLSGKKARRLKLKLLSNFGSSYFRLSEVKVLEEISPGAPSILEGVYAQPLAEEKLKERLNLAQVGLGGRVVSVSSEEYSHGAAYLIDGGVGEYEYWEASHKDPHPAITLAFFDDRPATLEAVVLHPGMRYPERWTRDVELWASMDKPDAGFERIGRFMLKQEPSYQLIAFAPRKVRYLKVVLLTSYDRWIDTHYGRLSEIAALEAKREGSASILAGVVTRLSTPQDVRGQVNIAGSALGGRVASVSSVYDASYKAENLIDEALGAQSSWVPARDQPPPHEIVFSFYKDREALIDKVILNPKCYIENASLARDFEVWVSSEASGENFRKVSRHILSDEPGDQVAFLPQPVAARRLKLKILTISWKGKLPALAEVKILEAPDPSRPSILSDLEVNLVDRRLGSALVYFSSQDWSAKKFASAFLEPMEAAQGWSSLYKPEFPLDLVFSFGELDEVLIQGVTLEGFENADTNPRQVALRTSLESPVRDFKTAGEDSYDFPAGSRELTVSFPAPVKARYLMVRILANHGGKTVALKSIRVKEGRAPGYLPLFHRKGKASEETQPAAAADPFPGLLAAVGGTPEQEPNDTPETAQPLALEQAVAGKMDSPGEVDFYRVDLTGADRDLLNLQLTGEPFIRTSLALTRPDDPSWVKTFSPEKAAGKETHLTWKVERKPHLLKVEEPKNSIVVVFDVSGSMEQSLPDLERAVTRYVQQVQPEEEIALIRFGSTLEVLSGFSGDPQALQASLQGKFSSLGGTAIFDAVAKGLELLSQRRGNRAMIVMTDGADTGSRLPYPKFWSLLEGAQKENIRIYTIGLGADLIQYNQALGATGNRMLLHVAAATGGKFFFAPASQELEGLYQRVAGELRMRSAYALRLSLGGGEGGLRLVETGEKIQGVGAPTIVEFILDASGSMSSSRGMKGGKKKITIAKEVLSELIRSMPEDYRLALRVYGHRFKGDKKDSELLFAPSKGNRDQMLKKIAKLQPVGLTPIAYSLTQVLNDLANLPGEKLVILVSDGEETGGGDPVKAAQQLHFMGVGVQVNVVGFDIAEKEVQEQMRQIAAMGGGRYYGAKNADELVDSLRQALRASFKIFDDAGEEVATGQVGQGEVRLPAGRYKVVVRPEDPITVENVEVRHKAVTEVKIKKEGDRIQTEWRIP